MEGSEVEVKNVRHPVKIILQQAPLRHTIVTTPRRASKQEILHETRRVFIEKFTNFSTYRVARQIANRLVNLRVPAEKKKKTQKVTITKFAQRITSFQTKTPTSQN